MMFRPSLETLAYASCLQSQCVASPANAVSKLNFEECLLGCNRGVEKYVSTNDLQATLSTAALTAATRTVTPV